MMRAGIGFDAHAFDPSRPLVLGGVTIEGHVGLGGHSDADVVTHAIADALLGAASAGDLGALFPNDERWKDASSITLLAEVIDVLRQSGWGVANVDATVIAETPRLEPYRSLMISNLAGVLGVAPQQVSVKATSTDGLGFTGRGDGIAAVAVALITSA